MQLFTINTDKKSRVFSLKFGKFIGIGVGFTYTRTSIDSNKRVIRRRYVIQLPLIKLEIAVYLP